MKRTNHLMTRKSLMRISLGCIVITCAVFATLPLRADVVTDWNQTTTQALTAAAVGFARQTRATAIVHAAMFDAMNAIAQRYRCYSFCEQADPGASLIAAGAAAAYRVLSALVPSQQALLDSAYASSLASVSDPTARASGISIGNAAADSLLAQRATDGSTLTATYTPTLNPGVWRPTPPAFAPAASVAWANVTPFLLQSADQFLPDGPPQLDSDDYTSDFIEIKSLGAINSATRTPDETEAALFWLENSNWTWNLIARIVSAQRNADSVDNARLFALLNMAGADAIIAGFRAKYIYGFWRPITAIREADTDGNPLTQADSLWLPLAPTPAHPDYPSNHSLYSAAAARVLAKFFHGDHAEFSLTTSTVVPNNAVRTYHSFSEAAEECGSSRVWLGYHFRTAVRDGLHEGNRIGKWASYFLARADDEEGED
jgi:PAP2 superfamily protein